MQLDETKVNEGRLLAAINLEGKLLEDATLQKKPFMERIALTKGLLQGIFERGDWISALNLAYTTGPIANLIDGNHEEILLWTITSAQQKKEDVYIYNGLERIFLKQWTRDHVFRFLTSVPINYNEYANWFKVHEMHFTDEQKEIINNQLGTIALENKEYLSACSFFRKAGKNEKIKEIQESLINQLNTENARNIIGLFLYDIAEKPLVERLVKKMFTLDQEKELHNVYALQKKYGLELSTEEKEKVAQARLEEMNKWDVEKESDPAVQLAWARKHGWKEPEIAYDILCEQHYQGKERLDLVQKIISEKHFGYTTPKNIYGRFERDELYAVFDELPITHQERIARYFDDKEKMRQVSKKLAEYGEKKTHIQQAYYLWNEGEGASDDHFVKELRKELYAKQNNELLWLHPKDVFGQVEAYYRVIDTDPKSAYELARNIHNNALLEHARDKFIQQSPEQAWQYFTHLEYSTQLENKKKRDETGEELALKQLGEKYHLPLEQVRQLLT